MTRRLRGPIEQRPPRWAILTGSRLPSLKNGRRVILMRLHEGAQP